MLRAIRGWDTRLIPKYLLEQIKEREYDIEWFYETDENGNSKICKDPTQFIYFLIDENSVIKGFFWLQYDFGTKNIFIVSVSIDQKYWGAGKGLKLVKKEVSSIVDYIAKQVEIRKVYWITSHPKIYESNGFVRAKNVLMEVDLDKGESDGGKSA